MPDECSRPGCCAEHAARGAMVPTSERSGVRPASVVRFGIMGRTAAWLLKAPIHAYRWTLKPFLGWPCRHLPTCSEYALEAISLNGAWRGFWLTVSRLARCQPWGTAGYDPVPDISRERHWLAPWRYGRWSGRHIHTHWRDVQDASK